MSERWDGKRWTVIVRTNGPLYAIACRTATSCVAVGGSYQTLIERWNGKSWSRASIGGANSYLSRVSCSSASSCLAIGQSDDGFPHPLVEQWNGARWSIVAGPAPPANGFNYLNGISCPTSTTCFAVGEQPPKVANGLMPLVERWNGRSWSALPTPALPGVYGGLFDISCTSETRCVAVGYRFKTDDTLIESWNGVRWSIDASPNRDPGFGNLLLGVSCASAADCFALGDSGDIGSGKSLIEHWDGASWTIVTSPNPTDTAGGLTAISCSTATSCLAVGNVSDGSTSSSQVEYWDGANWSITAFPNPNPDPATDIYVGVYGVSCATSTSCVAIGNYFDGSVVRSLVQHWNGASWSIDPEPPLPPFADDGGFRGITCPTSTSCLGVGVYDSLQSKFTLAERYS